MTNPISARHAALIVLHKTFTQDAYANLALNEILQKNPLSHVDRRLTTELVYGTVKNKAILEFWLKKFIPKYKDLPEWISLNLMLAVYQIHFMDKIPKSAAVNEAVILAKKYGHKGTIALTNGVLRNMLRTADAFALPDEKNKIYYLAIKYSHPEWIVEKWIDQFGFEETEALLAFDNKNPPLTIRINPLKTTRKALTELLNKDDVVCEEGKYSPYAIEVKGMPPLHNYQPFKDGLFQVQDESSMLAASILDPHPGEIVIDVCAAPGGKTTHIAELMGNEGKVLAFDVHEHKIKLINDNAERLGINIIQAKHLDARVIGEKYPEYADRVLVDAPCSGLGVLRRRPDARWRKDMADIKGLTILQSEILTSAALAVKKGGVLVYSTCTLSNEENIQVVDRFLEKNPHFVCEDITPFLPSMPSGGELTAPKGYITIYPHLHKIDGFFICRMHRRK